jgi:hypothetical protein
MPSLLFVDIEWVLRYRSFVDMSEYFGTGPLWTWVKNNVWCDPSSTGTQTRVKTIETCVESIFATVCVQSAIAGCFLLFWWGRLDWVALHQDTWSKKLNNKLKVVISPLSETKFESFTILFYGNLPNSAHGCIKTVVTAAVVTENVRMSSIEKLSQWSTEFLNNSRHDSCIFFPKTWSFADLSSLSRKFSAPHSKFKIP